MDCDKEMQVAKGKVSVEHPWKETQLVSNLTMTIEKETEDIHN